MANSISNNFFTPVLDAGKKISEVGSFLVTNTDAFNKVSKFALAIIGIIGTILKEFFPGAGAALDLLSKLKIGPEAAVTVTNATGIVERANEFADPKKFKDITKTPQKFISRIALTGGQALDTVSVLHTVEVVDIGPLNNSAMGKLSIINLVKNALITISSIFAIWDCGKTIQAEKSNNARAKLQHWTGLQQDAVQQHIQDKNYHEDTDVNAFQQYKVEKYTIKVNNSNNIIKKAWVSIAADIAKLAIITISSIALMFLITNPVALVIVGATGVVAASLNLVKAIYGEFGPKTANYPANVFDNA